jgi:hypothetical protein
MKPTKTVMLAALTVMYLGVGGAMAQESAAPAGAGTQATALTNMTFDDEHAGMNVHAPRFGLLDRGSADKNWGVPLLDYDDGIGCPPCH